MLNTQPLSAEEIFTQVNDNVPNLVNIQSRLDKLIEDLVVKLKM